MVDPRERMDDADEAQRVAADRHQSLIWTSMPVKVVEDSDGHTCKLQITIKGELYNTQSASLESVEIPQLGTVPIHFAAGGGLTITHPIKKDDEGMAAFQARCIDQWWQDGGVQSEPYRRRHDLSDAMYIPGFRNKPRQLNPAPSVNSVQIRTDDGKFYVELTKDGVCNIYAKETNIHSPRINMDGNQRSGDHAQNVDQADTAVEVKGTIHATKNISTDQSMLAKQDMTADHTVTGKQEVIARNIHLTTHRHTGVRSGIDNSGPPQSGS